MSKEYDIVSANVSDDLKGLTIVQQLFTKGFCVVNQGTPEEDLKKALEDVKEMDSIGKFSPPAEIISAGLFGAEGSARIAELDQPGELSGDGDAIKSLDDVMTNLAKGMIDVLADMGLNCPERTCGMVHETSSNVDADLPDLTIDQASLWLNTFTRQKVMIVMVLGPSKGILELRPFDEEAEGVELETTPGDLIVLRPDALSFTHTAHGTVNLLTCYMLEPRCLDRHSSMSMVASMCPSAKALDAWAFAKVEQLKSEENGINCRGDLPDDWTNAMNMLTFSGQRVAVRGLSLRCSPTWNAWQNHTGATTGVDLITKVPMTRFDVDAKCYDPDPEGWRRYKCFTTHCSFTDGLELFDNKFFGLSPAEAQGMDPMQMAVLEVGYEAAHHCGYTKKQMMNSWGGVYMATESADWQFVDKPLTASSGTGAAASITANRFSFCLGLKGPSIAFSSGGGSGLVAIHTGAEGVLDKGRGAINTYSLGGGVHFNYDPIFWPQFQAAGLLTPTGRCWSFNDKADGWLFQDGIGVCCMKRLTEKVEGIDVFIENEQLLGIIAGSRLCNNGAVASMSAPSAMAEQELLAETCKQAGITPLDVDAIECNAEGDVLKDAIEVGSAMRSLRYRQDMDIPLALTAIKASSGHSQCAAGALSFIRTIVSQAAGHIVPQPHLCELNPHMEFDDFSSIGAECMDCRSLSSYHGTSSYGFGGTLAHIITWGQLSEKHMPQSPVEWNKIVYWPGGGGENDEDIVARPRKGYHIKGTFSRWAPTEMEVEGEGFFGYTMTLGENRWESFQILLDGDATKILHPSAPKAHKGTLVVGPTADSGIAWTIDGRQSAELGGLDEGKIGDKYRIRLKIKGKYRTVDWVKLEPEAGAVAEKVPQGTYYLAAGWNGWTLEEMFRDDSQPDIHYIEVQKIDLRYAGLGGAYFQIVRNEDWEQTIYPERHEGDTSTDVLGPDDHSQDRCWIIPREELPVRIELHRSSEGGVDAKSVTWKTI
mmetsp:Transcript_53485/g.95171  ORF Transcript_53485/g.95171 Transcript_53485/m.95171 type:complete len:990 (-) Transcript_53485:202-3171(-)